MILSREYRIAGLWFALVSLLAERLFGLIVGTWPGMQWAGMVGIWSFIIGGFLGRNLFKQTASSKTIVLTGLGVPSLTLYASSVCFGLVPAISNLVGSQPLDGAKQLIFSPLLGLVVAGSGLLVTSWLILPIGMLASWMLFKCRNFKIFVNRV